MVNTDTFFIKTKYLTFEIATELNITIFASTVRFLNLSVWKEFQ